MNAFLKFFYRWLKARLGLFSPFELNFAITYMCNSRCKICNIWKIKSENELTLEEIEKIAKNIKFIHWLRLTGGEPFLRKDYVDIVKVLNKELDLYFLSVPTNALMPKVVEKKVKEVLKFFRAKHVVSISLDGPRNIHENIRGMPGAWNKAIETYRNLKKLEKNHKNFKVVFGYTISPYNVGYFEETFNEVKKIFPKITRDDFHINVYQTSEVYYHTTKSHIKDLDFSEFSHKAIEEIKDILSKESSLRILEFKVNEFIETIYKKLAVKYLTTMNMPVHCNIYNLSAFIDPYGDVYPCTIFNIKLGNLRENNYNLLEVLNSKQAVTVRKLIERKKCPHCWTPCEAHQIIMTKWPRI